MEVHIHTNNSCNLQCRHCYNRSIYGDASAQLSKDEIIKLVSLFHERYNAEFHIEGGEIFLMPEILQVFEEIPDCLASITITTNGTILPKDQKIFMLLRRIQALRVSVEGHTDIENELIRGIGLTDVLNNTKRFYEENIPVWLRITLNRVNYHDIINKTLPYFIDKGFRNIQIYEFQAVGRGYDNSKDFSLNYPLKEMFMSLVNNGVYKNAHVKIMLPKKRISEAESYREKLNARGIKVRQLVPEEGVSIHSDGNVFICPWENDLQKALFNIREFSYGMWPDLLKQHKLIHDCDHCSAVIIESGGA